MNKLLSIFRRPSAKTLAQGELEEARRQLLQAKTAAEYATRLAQYHEDRIRRLTTYIREADE